MAIVDVTLREWETVGPDGQRGEALRRVWLDDPNAARLAKSLARERVLEVTETRSGLTVRATSFVGRIQLGSVRITIEPKIARDHLLQLFRYAYGLRDLTRIGQSSADSGLLFRDVLLLQLHAEVDELRRRGLLHQYVRRVDDLSSPRGRIDVERLASQGGLVRTTIPCRHAPRTADHLLNRAALAGVAWGTRHADEPTLRHELRHLVGRLDDAVARVPLDRGLVRAARRSLSRLSTAYEPMLTILDVLLDGSAIALADGEFLPIPGFLYDMNRFFQALVERLLRDHLPECELRTETGLTGMIKYVLNPRGRRAPQPRPDFTLRQRGGGMTLLDAKYRDLWEKPLPREMLYQLALYATSQPEARSASIIYPSVAREASEARIEIRRPVGGAWIGSVELRPLHLETIAVALNAGTPNDLRPLIRRAALGGTPTPAS